MPPPPRLGQLAIPRRSRPATGPAASTASPGPTCCERSSPSTSSPARTAAAGCASSPSSPRPRSPGASSTAWGSIRLRPPPPRPGAAGAARASARGRGRGPGIPGVNATTRPATACGSFIRAPARGQWSGPHGVRRCLSGSGRSRG